MKSALPPRLSMAAALALLLGCGADATLEKRHVTHADPLPSIAPPVSAADAVELDLAAPAKYETATFALGWFWGPDSRFGGLPGVLRTRVGYSGGTTTSPTYRSMGDHSEAIQIDFDPEVIGYAKLLEEFLSAHNPCRPAFRVQYRSAVFFHDEAQREAAEQATRSYGMGADREVQTGLEAFTGFTLAEDYHQKYILRSDRVVMAELEQRYPTTEEFLAAPTVTRANAFLAGHGSDELRTADLPRMGLSTKAQERLR